MVCLSQQSSHATGEEMQFHVGPQWYRIAVCLWGISAHAKLFCSWLKFLWRIWNNHEFFVMEVHLASWLYPTVLLGIRVLAMGQMFYVEPQGFPFDCISQGNLQVYLTSPRLFVNEEEIIQNPDRVFYIMICKDPLNSIWKLLKYAAWWGAAHRQTFIIVIFSMELETCQMVLWWMQWDKAESIAYITFSHVAPLSTFLDQFYGVLELSILHCWTLLGNIEIHCILVIWVWEILK